MAGALLPPTPAPCDADSLPSGRAPRTGMCRAERLVMIRTCTKTRSIILMSARRAWDESVTRTAPRPLRWTAGVRPDKFWIEWPMWLPLTSRARLPAPRAQKGEAQKGEQCPPRRSRAAVVETVVRTLWAAAGQAGRGGTPWTAALAKQDVVEPDERRGTGAIRLITQRSQVR
jgi:hypothetical protein